MNLLVKFPTRGRLEKFRETYSEYMNKMSKFDKTFIYVTADFDDKQMHRSNLKFMYEKRSKVFYGISSSKIHAVNRDMGLIDGQFKWDILLLASDDMIPQVHGYDEIIRQDMQKYYPDTDGVLWYNDGYAGNKLNTLVCMGRKYFERFGYIYHPAYKSLWCDNEFMLVADKLGKQTYIDNVIIKHEHPANNSEIETDARYIATEKYYHEDKKVFEARKKKNFFL